MAVFCICYIRIDTMNIYKYINSHPYGLRRGECSVRETGRES